MSIEKRWLKAELHAHCRLDPIDYRICAFSPEELIERAAALGYQVLAFTCHDVDIWTEELADFARMAGVTLIPGMEVTTERTRHTLVYNFRASAGELDTLKKIRARAREDTLVVAPHAYFPERSCLKGLLEKNLDVFDAIEWSGFYIPGVDYNRKGIDLAARACKPLVGNGDIHHLWQLGRTFTWIYAEPSIASVVNSVKQGFVRVECSPLSWSRAVSWWAVNAWRYVFPANPRPQPLLPAEPPPFPGGSLEQVEDGGGFGAEQESVEP